MRLESSGKPAGILAAICLVMVAASGGSAPASEDDDIPHIVVCDDHDSLHLLGWHHATDRFFPVDFVKPNGTVAATTNVELSGTRGASLSVGDFVSPFDGSCVVPYGVTALVQGRNADGTATPIYGPLSSSGGSDLLPAIWRDKSKGVTSKILLLNPNDFALSLATYCNSAANEPVGGEQNFNIPSHGRASFTSRGSDNQTCDIVNNSPGGGRVVVGVRTDFKGSGDYIYTPGVLTADFGAGKALVPLVHGGPDASNSPSIQVYAQNLGLATEARYTMRDGRGKTRAAGTIELPERSADGFVVDSFFDIFVGETDQPTAWQARLEGDLADAQRAAGDAFATAIPGYTTANATSDTAVVLGFDYPVGATLTYRAVNAGKKTAKIRVTIGRLDGTVVSTKQYELVKRKLKKYATAEIAIPAAEQGNDLYVRTEVLKKGPVVTYVEVLHSNGRVTYFPGQNEQ